MSQRSFAHIIPAVCVFMLTVGSCCPGAEVSQAPVYQLDAVFNTPQAIDVDRYGRIYVLDNGRHTLMRFGLTGVLEKTWSSGVHEAQFAGGRDWMSIAPEGTIFLGPEFRDCTTKRIALDGTEATFPEKWGVGGEGRSVVIWPKDDGSYHTFINIFDTSDPTKTGDQTATRIDAHGPDGKVTQSWTLPPVHIACAAPDGLLYAIEDKKPVVTVYGLDGKVRRQINLAAAWPNGAEIWFANIGVAENGDIYVAEGSDYYHFNAKGELLAKWNANAPYTGGMTLYSQRFAVRNGLIYVIISIGNSSIIDVEAGTTKIVERDIKELRVFAPDGQCLARYVARKSELNMPASIAVQSDNSYAVVMHGVGSARIYGVDGKKFEPSFIHYPMTPINVVAKPGGGFYFGLEETDPKGKPIKSLYVRNDLIPEPYADYPVQIAIDPTTKQLWSLGCGGSISGFNPDGSVIKQLAMKSELNFRTWAVGMAIDSRGFIYMADPWGHRVLKVDKDANIITTWGKQGFGMGEMNFPEGIVIDNQDRVYVADCENSRIQVFDTEGKPLGVWGQYGFGDGELNRPFALAMGPNDTLWISDTFNDRIVKIPLIRFWAEAKTTVTPKTIEPVPALEPAPELGDVTISGVVVAGSDDLTDAIYIESPDRAWGVSVALPAGKRALRGEHIQVKGKLELVGRAARHLWAKTIDRIVDKPQARPRPIAPLGMANLFVGDGFRQGDTRKDLSNQGILVMSWGRVTSVESDKGYFVINDGSYPADKGLMVWAGRLAKPLEDWPTVGSYVGVTGISTTATDNSASRPGIRIRNQDDIAVFQVK